MEEQLTYPKRLIEVDLPIRRISEHARREKSVRHGHISSIHIWWARRPLAACRVVICAALWPDPADPQCPQEFREKAVQCITSFANKVIQDGGLTEHCSQESWRQWNEISKVPLEPFDSADLVRLRGLLLDFLSDFANWDNSTEKAYLDTCRALTQSAYEALGGERGSRPVVVDPFAGGGALPLEALRIGANSFSGDLNPVAALLNSVTQEYIPRFGDELVEKVAFWGEWLLKRAKEELSVYYPPEVNGSTVIGYLWARTILCEGPGCGVEVPIIKSCNLSRRKGSETAISIEYDGKQLSTRLVRGARALKLLEGTSKRSSVTCPRCGFTTQRTRVAAQANGGGFGFHLSAIALRGVNGERTYRSATSEDYAILEKSDHALMEWDGRNFGGIPAIPTEELPYLRSIFNVRVYGIDQWSKIFHRRQLLSALVFTSLVREAAAEIQKTTADVGLSSAIINCLALSVSNSLQYQCNIATFLTEGVKSAFIQGQSLPMKMDFIEANPLMDDLAGGYAYSLEQHLSGLRYVASYKYPGGTAHCVSALERTLPDNYADLLATDPPYYDVVPYADCSDFFYVWLRRMLRGATSFPSNHDLTPKEEEIVQLAERNERYKQRTKAWFELKMREALTVARENIKHTGMAVIVFAHKDTAAWEALLKSVLDAGWMVTASWPIDTEKGSRLRANESAVLASSIHLVCRPVSIENAKNGPERIGDWRQVLSELPVRIHEWMPRLAMEGIVGADAIFACIGPALEIFSRYSRVETAAGEVVPLGDVIERGIAVKRGFLSHVWEAVAKEALALVFEGADMVGFEEDARLTAMWLWTLKTDDRLVDEDDIEEAGDHGGEEIKKSARGYVLEYDAARKIAQGLGVHLEDLTSLVEIKGEVARLLSVEERARGLLGKDSVESQGKRRRLEKQIGLFEIIGDLEENGPRAVNGASFELAHTVLDRIHQSMLLFATGRGEALRRFLVDDAVGSDQRFWTLAQALSALYPTATDEKRWVDGVLARKKSLGF